MAQKTKHTVRVESAALDRAKRYAAADKTSLSKLISEYLARPNEEASPAPVLRKLTGILPTEAPAADHRAFLAKKYGS